MSLVPCRLTSALSALLLLTSLSPAAGAEPAAPKAAVPVFFAPLSAPRALSKHAGVLRELLSARMVATGQFAETVTAEHAQMVQSCIRDANREANAETCWVRLGQGQGAQMMVSGELDGDRKSCSVVLRLTVLETRLTKRKVFETSEPCGRSDLVRVFERAARQLAGLPPKPAPGGEAAQGSGGRGPGASDAGAAADSGLRCEAPGKLVRVGQRRFCYYSTREPWARAAARCGATGGRLARIHNAAESFAIHEAIGAPQGWQIWLGMTDKASEGVWVDGAGERVRYTHWNRGEPNNAGEEDCGTMLTHANWRGGWNDSPCTERYPAACQIPKQRQPDCKGRSFLLGSGACCVVPQPLLRQQAVAHCKALGGGLALPRDDVQQAAFAEGVETTTAWIDISDQQQEGVWRYGDGTRATYLPWSEGEPNDAGGNEDCGGIHTLDGTWNDDDCSAPRPYVCSD